MRCQSEIQFLSAEMGSMLCAHTRFSLILNFWHPKTQNFRGPAGASVRGAPHTPLPPQQPATSRTGGGSPRRHTTPRRYAASRRRARPTSTGPFCCAFLISPAAVRLFHVSKQYESSAPVEAVGAEGQRHLARRLGSRERRLVDERRLLGCVAASRTNMLKLSPSTHTAVVEVVQLHVIATCDGLGVVKG